MRELTDQQAVTLNAYLDGELDARERAEFESLVESDDRLRAALDGARRVASGVRTDFERAEGIDFETLLESDLPSRPPVAWRAIGLAACLAVVASIFVAINLPGDDRLRADAAYAAVTAAFVPEVICDTREKFEAYTIAHLGEGLCPIDDPEIRMIGWRGLPVMAASGYEGMAKVLLAEDADGERIVVLFLSDSAEPPVAPRGGDIRMFQRTFEGVRAWEITPLDGARVVELLEACGASGAGR